MSFTVILGFVGEIDTQKEVENLYKFLSSEDTLEIADKIGLVLYGFEISHKKSQWTYNRRNIA